MLGSAIIVFREVLEAALIVAIVMGATRGISHRGRWVASGIGLGVLGAVVVAWFAGAISQAMAGSGQEIFNAVVLLSAVVMLGWHNVWMSSHGRKLAADMKAMGHDVNVGSRPLSALLIVTSLAVLREGSETVLFLYGLMAGSAGVGGMVAGAFMGLGAGVLVGWMLYRGLLRIPVGHFFSITGWVVLLLASGLSASAAGYLTQAGLLPMLISEVWDSSWLLNQGSTLGTLLHVLVGYNDRPTGIQVVFYLTTLIVTLALMRWARRHEEPVPRRQPARVGAATNS
jgi:high-affinity iron transporter